MNTDTSRRFYRSRDHRMIAGVAGGIAEYLGIDPLIVRVLWVVAAIAMLPVTAPLLLVLYLALAVMVPLGPSRMA